MTQVHQTQAKVKEKKKPGMTAIDPTTMTMMMLATGLKVDESLVVAFRALQMELPLLHE